MKKSKKQAKIKDLCDFSSEGLLEIPLLLKVLDKTKSRAKSYDVPFYKNIIVKDFCLRMRPEKEDVFYSINGMFLQNVRKGNSIIEFLSEIPEENSKSEDIIKEPNIDNNGSQLLEKLSKSERYIARRGLMKFFDLKLAFLKKNILNKEEFNMKERIFREIEISLKEKKKVVVFKTSKENGTNVQISYVNKCSAWLVASKNTSILIRDEKDILLYDSAEFGLTKDLACNWLKTLANLDEKQLENIKSMLKSNTLMGEFINGDKKSAKILKYEKAELRFFALVELKSTDTCVPPSKTKDFLEKSGLKSVHFEVLLETDSVDFLYQELKKFHRHISQSPLEIEGEGSVLYFVIKDEKNNEKVASLCKLKTLEYRLYRKIREKLKKIQVFSKFPKNLMKSYIREAKALVKESDADIDLDFYINLAEEFFYQITENHSPENFRKAVNLFSVYIEKSVWNVRNGIKRNIFKEIEIVIILGSLKVEEWENVMKEVKNAKFIKEFDKKIIGELEGRVVLSEESGKIENLLEIAEKSDKMSIFSIGESEELMKFKGKTMNFKNIVKIETIDQKTFTENLLINSITQAFHDFSLHLVKPSSTKPHNPNKKTLYVFIPMGIPCMGKSHFLPIFANFFEEKGFEFHTISSDLIHKELIDEQFKKNQNKKNVDFEEIHDKTTKKAKSLFIERFSSLMKKINTSKNTLQVLFVDKNHPPNGIDKAMGLITADGAKNVDLKIIAIAPFFENGSKIHNLPFSLGFVETCLKRSLARPEHETLRGDAIKVFDIILMFCRMYKGFKMSSEYLKSLGFDDLWLLPYHKEKIIEGEEKEMKNLESCLNNRGNIKELISWIEGKEVGEEVGEAEFREKLKGGWEKMEGSQEENMDEEMWDSCQEENDENFD